MSDDNDQTQQQIGGEPPEPPADPPADPPAEPGPDAPKAHRLSRRPQNTNGAYMCLAAPLDADEVSWFEVGYYRAHAPEGARRQVIADAEAGHLPFIAKALEGKGVWIRPVPALNWPKLDHPSGVQIVRKLVI